MAEVAVFSLGKMLDQRKNRGDSLPYLANKNVRWGEFDLTELREMRFEERELERFSVKNGDIVMCEGGEPGRCAIWREQLPKMMYQKALHRIRPHEGMNEVFLYYNLSHRAKAGHLSGLFTGATIKHLPKEKLALVEVDVPDIPIQERIAAILSAYDDLIENNRRRIALLEQAARLLYREWFVHFRFPGHETATFMDGLPEGWLSTRVGNLGSVITGKTPPKKVAENFGGPIPFIKTPDMHGNIFVISTDETLTEQGAKTQAKKTLPPGSILVSCIGTVGVVTLNATEAQFNQQINAVVPDPENSNFYVYFALENIKPKLEALGGGVTMANVSKSKFESVPVPLPHPTVQQEFHETVAPMFDQVLQLARLNAQLTRARDLLLPRLMDGRIPVSV
ncbi:MAG: restriction endonuclease subunit S [Rhodobacterales bacterium]|nr:restriction endonuclease subunit S [Rhodobacterales bacterium]